MTREDMIVVCEESIDALEEMRAYLVNNYVTSITPSEVVKINSNPYN